MLTPPLQKLSDDTGDIHKVILPGAGVFWYASQTNPICHHVLSSHRASYCIPPKSDLFAQLFSEYILRSCANIFPEIILHTILDALKMQIKESSFGQLFNP